MPQREHLRRLRNVWIKRPIYFVTVCTDRRRKILANPTAAQILNSSWLAAPDVHRWIVGRYTIMPDHIHFFTTPVNDAKPISKFLGDWKRWTAKQLIGASALSPPIWQKEFFDHVVRSNPSYEQKWGYVRENPVRAGLAASPDSWPFSGECATLTFSD